MILSWRRGARGAARFERLSHEFLSMSGLQKCGTGFPPNLLIDRHVPHLEWSRISPLAWDKPKYWYRSMRINQYSSYHMNITWIFEKLAWFCLMTPNLALVCLSNHTMNHPMEMHRLAGIPRQAQGHRLQAWGCHGGSWKIPKTSGNRRFVPKSASDVDFGDVTTCYNIMP